MGLSTDPQAFVPVASKTDLRAAGTEARTTSIRPLQLDPLIAALGKASERSAKWPLRDNDSGSSR